MCFYLTYLLARIFYQTFWFYWGGYVIIFASLYIPWKNEIHEDAKHPAFPSYREYVGDYQGNEGLKDVNNMETFHEQLEYGRYNEEIGAFQELEDYFLHSDPYFEPLHDGQLEHENWIYGFYIHDDLMKKLNAQEQQHELQIEQLNAKFDLEREEWQKAFAALKLELGV